MARNSGAQFGAQFSEAVRGLCRYDTNADGKIDRQELGRMLKELDKDKLQVSETLIERYVESEFAKVDADASGGISYDEFVEYAAQFWRNSGAILGQFWRAIL